MDYPRTFTITASGDSLDDVLCAIDEARRVIENGNLSGFGENETGSYSFDSRWDPAEDDSTEGDTVEALIAKYGQWGEHVRFSREEWSAETVAGDTSLGYWEWVIQQQETFGDDDEDDEDGAE